MATFAYARTGNANVELSLQITSLKEAGCSSIAIDRSNSPHPRDLRRRAALLGNLQPDDVVMVYSLECLAVLGSDLVRTIADIRSRKAVLRTTGPDYPNTFCNDTIDAIASAFGALDRPLPERKHNGPRSIGRSPILTPADWLRVRKGCAMMGKVAAARLHNVSRSTLYSFIARMDRETGIQPVTPLRKR